MQITPFAVLVTNLVVALFLAAGATASPRMRTWAPQTLVLTGLVFAGLALVDLLLLGLFVFGEDDYRDNGISRWDAYRRPGGALGPMFVSSIVLLSIAAALLAFAGLRRRTRLLGATAFGAALVCLFLVTATILGFSLN